MPMPGVNPFPNPPHFDNAGMINGRRFIMTTRKFLCYTSKGVIVVPRFFTCDGGSIPRILRTASSTTTFTHATVSGSPGRMRTTSFAKRCGTATYPVLRLLLCGRPFAHSGGLPTKTNQYDDSKIETTRIPQSGAPRG